MCRMYFGLIACLCLPNIILTLLLPSPFTFIVFLAFFFICFISIIVWHTILVPNISLSVCVYVYLSVFLSVCYVSQLIITFFTGLPLLHNLYSFPNLKKWSIAFLLSFPIPVNNDCKFRHIEQKKKINV